MTYLTTATLVFCSVAFYPATCQDARCINACTSRTEIVDLGMLNVVLSAEITNEIDGLTSRCECIVDVADGDVYGLRAVNLILENEFTNSQSRRFHPGQTRIYFEANEEWNNYQLPRIEKLSQFDSPFNTALFHFEGLCRGNLSALMVLSSASSGSSRNNIKITCGEADPPSQAFCKPYRDIPSQEGSDLEGRCLDGVNGTVVGTWSDGGVVFSSEPRQQDGEVSGDANGSDCAGAADGISLGSDKSKDTINDELILVIKSNATVIASLLGLLLFAALILLGLIACRW